MAAISLETALLLAPIYVAISSRLNGIVNVLAPASEASSLKYVMSFSRRLSFERTWILLFM